MSAVHIFGIRHHGPGSARSLQQALEVLQPDCVLVEGPPDAQELVPFLAHEAMQLPAALLLYVPDAPHRAAFYPFADFSPETVALRWALAQNVPARFMDWPLAYQLLEPESKVDREQKAEAKPASEQPPTEQTEPQASEGESEVVSETPVAQEELTPEKMRELIEAARNDPRRDPLKWLAEAAGYDDSERWWEDLVEHRLDDAGIFEAVLEAMTALRAELDAQHPREGEYAETENCREAWMRQSIRAAQNEGFERIAVVCGAWHGPALAGTLPMKFSAKEDAALLKGKTKIKVSATWIPWTNERLSSGSGYGAGIESPGWYGHLWQSTDNIATRWLSRASHLLRSEGLDVSPAHVIEAVRLAETLAALRGRPFPGLGELNEASQAVLCFGGDGPLTLIFKKLIVGEVMGAVPGEAPSVPLQLDLERETRRLRLKKEASHKDLDLDLRLENDLARSQLLHRLNLLGVNWASAERSSGKGTFRESWKLQWAPELELKLIEAGVWGNTLRNAASQKAISQAQEATELPPLTHLVSAVLLCDLPDATPRVMERLENVAATSSDVAHLMDALPPLARVWRYGDVRGTRPARVEGILRGLAERIFINLPPACASMNEDAAREMKTRLDSVGESIALLQTEDLSRDWNGCLRALASRSDVPGLLAGRAVRMLLDAQVLSDDEAARAMGQALSTANEPGLAASWIEGFLGASGLLLLHDERLMAALDDWLCSLSEETFIPILPLLRRTFSQFAAAERRNLADVVAKKSGGAARATSVAPGLNQQRAARVLPTLATLLGIEFSPAEVPA